MFERDNTTSKNNYLEIFLDDCKKKTIKTKFI